MKTAKKPDILQDKIKVAEIIKSKWSLISKPEIKNGYYWSGEFQSPDKSIKVYIYFQRYVRNPTKVDYIKMRYIFPNENYQPNLNPADIKTLLKGFMNDNYR